MLQTSRHELADSDRLQVSVSGQDGEFFSLLPVNNVDPDKSPSWYAQVGSWYRDLTDVRDGRKGTKRTVLCLACDVNANVIRKTWGDRIDFAGPLSENTFVRHEAAWMARQQAAMNHAAWYAEKKLPVNGHLEVHPELPLSPYQRVPASISINAPGYALFMDMGTGKTPVTVCRMMTEAAKVSEAENRMYRALVACPKNVRMNWANEINRFATLPGKVKVLRGGAIKRIRILTEAMKRSADEAFTVVVMSYGLLVSAWDDLLSHVPWDLAVLDESHMIARPSTLRTKTCLKLRDNARHRMVLTGTPIVNSALDLYSQLEFMDRGLSGHSSFNSFKKEYGVFENRGGRESLVEVQNIPRIKERLSQVAFLVRLDEVLKDLPEKQYDVLEVEMSKRQADDYVNLSSQLYLEIKDEFDNAKTSQEIALVVNNALTKLMKLAQITSGFLILTEERDEYGEIVRPREVIRYPENPKLDLLLSEIQVMGPNDKFQVWSCWTEDMKILRERLSSAGVDFVEFHGSTPDSEREEAERRFNGDPTCRGIIGNPEAGGVGLNLIGYDHWEPTPKLDTNCTRVFYYAQSHKPVHRWQSEGRGHRRGTRVPVRITDLCVPETIDEDIRARVLMKKKHALDVQDLTEILSKIAERK